MALGNNIVQFKTDLYNWFSIVIHFDSKPETPCILHSSLGPDGWWVGGWCWVMGGWIKQH